MKRRIIRIVLLLAGVIILAILALYSYNGLYVRKNIKMAKSQYKGSGEEALIKMVRDTTRSPYVRTHMAIWTLGKIRSEQALPLLLEVYNDDPEGVTCFGKHDSLLCQYEIHKAIVSIQEGFLFSHAHLKRSKKIK